jgi:hypothetical protein
MATGVQEAVRPPHRRKEQSGRCPTRACVELDAWEWSARPRDPRQVPRSAVPLAGAMAVVVLAFLASLWASHQPLSNVGDRTGDLVRNALPSIEHLARARTSLIRMSGALLDGGPPRDAVRTRIDAARAALDHELGEYLSLPVSPEERQRFSTLPRQLRELDESISAVLAEADAATPPGAGELAAARRGGEHRAGVAAGECARAGARVPVPARRIRRDGARCRSGASERAARGGATPPGRGESTRAGCVRRASGS